MRSTGPLLLSILLLAPAAPLLPPARADEEEVQADDEEPPPPDEAPAPEQLLTMLGGDREDEALPLLRGEEADAALAVARRLLETASEPRLLIGAAEWVAEKTPPPPPGKPVDPADDRAAAIRQAAVDPRGPGPARRAARGARRAGR